MISFHLCLVLCLISAISHVKTRRNTWLGPSDLEQSYQSLHDSMLCTWSMVTSVTCGYLWLPALYRYCMSLCCVRGVRLPPLPGGYLWLPLVTSVTRYCMSLCCVRGVRLPPLPSGYLWLPLVTSVTRYCMTLYACTWSTVTSITWWLPVVTFGYHRYQVLHVSMLCTWSTVTSVTWWLPVVAFGYQHYQVLHDYAVYVEYGYLRYLWLPLVTSVTRYCMAMLCTWSTVTSVTWWLPVVTFGYQRYQVLHDSMLCTWSVVTSVTWWLPAVTMCYQRYQVLLDSMLCTWSTVTSVTWWLPVVTMCYQRYQILHDSICCVCCIL